MRGARRTLTLMKIGLLCGLLAIALSMPAQNSRSGTVASALDSFDTPLKKKVVDFGPSPYYPNTKTGPHIKLSCFYFPTFMVKEYDEGQKGAEWLAIAPIKSKELPACTKSNEPGENITKKAGKDDWCGYFKGVKENLVFCDASDGTDGGMPFVVYDSKTGKKVFEDADCLRCIYVKKMYGKEPPSAPFDRMRISKVPGGPVTLKYLRVEQADCDLRSDKSSCWDHVRMKLNAKSPKAPVCFGYDNIPVGELPSMVAHPVLVSLESPPVVKSIDGPVICWSPD